MDAAEADGIEPADAGGDLTGDSVESDWEAGAQLDIPPAGDDDAAAAEGIDVAPDSGALLDSGDAAGVDDLLKDAGDADSAQAADVAADATTAVDGSADVTVLVPPPDQPKANVLVQLSSAMAAVSGTLVLVAVAPGEEVGAFSSAGGGVSFGTQLWSGPAPKLPAAVWIELPAGPWLIIAMVLQPGQKMPVAGGMTCGSAGPAMLQGGGAPQLAKVDLLDAATMGGGKSPCKPPAPMAPPAFMTQQSFIPTPPTAYGGAHFMNALVYGDRMWVAGSQDGYVSFDFPGGMPITTGLANWTVHGGPSCNRLTRVENILFCSSRSGYLQILELNAAQDKLQMQQKWFANNGMVTEGMALQQGSLYLALHKGGITAIQPTAPYQKLEVTSPPGLTEAWDVAALGKDWLVVANGGLGLSVLQVGGGKKLAPVQVGQLPLPGVSAYLAVEGLLVAVGAMGGGLHLVDVSPAGQPKLRATLASPTNIYGVALAGAQVFAAAGQTILAADVPGLADPGPWRARGSLGAMHFALDVDPHASGLLVAEFQSVRRLELNLQAGLQGPVMVAPTHLAAGVAPVGGKLVLTVPVHNAGSEPLHIDSMEWFETKGFTVAPFKVQGPWTIPPGGSADLTLTPPKLIKGVLDHQLILYSDDINQPQHFIMQLESAWLQPGDTLPAMPTYQDAGGFEYKIPQYFKGKVGVLLIGAQSCPVAFQALAAASRDLAPWLKNGTVAALGINPWDDPKTPEAAAFNTSFPLVYSGLTTSDGHDWSAVLDVDLGQPVMFGPPMPIVYVVGKDGKLVVAQWGYDSVHVLKVIQQELAKP